mgnify:CR=1 FL=1
MSDFPGRVILTTVEANAVILTGTRGLYTTLGNPKGEEYVQVGLLGRKLTDCHVGWLTVRDLTAALEW